jgi:hypothetical protein
MPMMVTTEKLLKILPSPERRRELQPNSKSPYYLPLQIGVGLGYRRNLTVGSWVMRCSVAPQKQHVAVIGQADDLSPADNRDSLNFEQAQARVRTLLPFKSNWSEVLRLIKLWRSADRKAARSELIQMLAEEQSDTAATDLLDPDNGLFAVRHHAPGDREPTRAKPRSDSGRRSKADPKWPPAATVKLVETDRSASPDFAHNGPVALVRTYLSLGVYADLMLIKDALGERSLEDLLETAISEWVDRFKRDTEIVQQVTLTTKPRLA